MAKMMKLAMLISVFAMCLMVAQCSHRRIDCSDLTFNVADCAPYLSKWSGETNPDKTCCSSLKKVVRANPTCMCYALESSKELGFDLNVTRASSLSSECGIHGPIFHQCNHEFSISLAPIISFDSDSDDALSISPSPVASSPFAAPPDTATSICMDIILDMIDCLSYLGTGTDAEIKPDETCCLGLVKVVKANASCLCDVLEKSSDYGIDLNMTRALSLPSTCHINSPVIDQCHISMAPAASPSMFTGSDAPIMSPISNTPATSPSSEFDESSPAPSLPGTGEDCMQLVLTNMGDCIVYLSQGGDEADPEPTCCQGLGTVLQHDTSCLCKALENSTDYGLDLNMTRALSLPSTCHINVPVADQCQGPVSSLSPLPMSPPTPAPTSNESVPATPPVPASSFGSPELAPPPLTTMIGAAPTTAPKPEPAPANDPSLATSWSISYMGITVLGASIVYLLA